MDNLHSDQTSHPQWIVWDMETGKLVRVLEDCPEMLVMLTGEWSNQYRFTSWDEILRYLRRKEDLLGKPDKAEHYTREYICKKEDK